MKFSNSAVLRDDERTPIANAEFGSSLAMFPLDFDTNDEVTSLDTKALETRDRSYIGARPREENADTLLDAVSERHVALANAISHLEDVCGSFESVDTSANAAQISLRRRVGTLAMLCRALENVVTFVESPEHEGAFAGDGLLAPYLAGIYLWAGDVNETLAALACDLNGLAPDWAAFRDRLNDVSWIFDMALSEGRRLEGVRDLVPTEMHDAMDELLVAFVSLKHKLDEPFG